MDTSYIQNYANSITSVINDVLVPTLIAVAFITFLWGVYVHFIKGADDPKAQETGRTFMLYGIIGFVVLFSVWGIVQIFMGTLGLTATNAPAFPTLGGVKYANGEGCYRNDMCLSGYCSGEVSGVCSPMPRGTGTLPGGSTGGSSGVRPGGGGTYAGGGYQGGGGAVTVTCGTFFQSVCAPGVTSCTAFGFCDDSTATGGNTGGSPIDIPGWGVSCVGTGQSTCNPGLECIYNICAGPGGGTGTGGTSCEAQGLVTNDQGGCSGQNLDKTVCESSGGSYDSYSNWCSCSGNLVTENGQCVYSSAAGEASCINGGGTYDSITDTCTYDYMNGGTVPTDGCTGGMVRDEFGGCYLPSNTTNNNTPTTDTTYDPYSEGYY